MIRLTNFKLIVLFTILSLLYPNNGVSKKNLINLDEPLIGLNKKEFPFYVYRDAHFKNNNFIPSGWMGDWGDLRFNGIYSKDSKKGKYCSRIKYLAHRKQQYGWSGIYWQSPSHNWGGVKGGYDLRGAKKLYFYARGEKGDEYAEFRVGGIRGIYSDSVQNVSTGVVNLTTNWQLYEIDLTGNDMKYVSGGFCVVFSKEYNPYGCTIYIDEIYYTDKQKIIINDQISLPIIQDRQINRIAVMEFENISEKKDLKYISKVISEAISTTLGKQKKLTVMDSLSIRKNLKKLSLTMENFNDHHEDVILGKILGVDIIIRGSYLEIDNRIQINIKLIDVYQGTILTSEQIKGRSGKDLFLLLDTTSKYIAKQITKLNKELSKNKF